MVMVLEGCEAFGQLQLKRIDWKQEMFAEEVQSEREREKSEESPDLSAARGHGLDKATSVRQPMEVDEEATEASVDATKLVEEKKQWREE